MQSTRAPKIGKRRASSLKRRKPLASKPAGKAQVQALGGILSTIFKLPKIFQMIVQVLPLIRMFMSYSSQSQTTPALPPGSEEGSQSEETANPIADEENAAKDDDTIEKDQHKKGQFTRLRKRGRKLRSMKGKKIVPPKKRN